MVVAAVATLRARIARAEQRPRPPPEAQGKGGHRYLGAAVARLAWLTRPVSIRLSARSFQTFLVSTRRPCGPASTATMSTSTSPIPKLAPDGASIDASAQFDGKPAQFTHTAIRAHAAAFFDHDGLHARGRPVDRLLGGVGLLDAAEEPEEPPPADCVEPARPPRRGAPHHDAGRRTARRRRGAATVRARARARRAGARRVRARRRARAVWRPVAARRRHLAAAGGGAAVRVGGGASARPRRARPVDHGAEPVQGGRRHLGVLHVRGDDADDAAAVQVRPVQRDAPLPRL